LNKFFSPGCFEDSLCWNFTCKDSCGFCVFPTSDMVNRLLNKIWYIPKRTITFPSGSGFSSAFFTIVKLCHILGGIKSKFSFLHDL
ncbi:hypothetical protein L9F63_024202, partial [Diploptera punctata]